MTADDRMGKLRCRSACVLAVSLLAITGCERVPEFVRQLTDPVPGFEGVASTYGADKEYPSVSTVPLTPEDADKKEAERSSKELQADWEAGQKVLRELEAAAAEEVRRGDGQ